MHSSLIRRAISMVAGALLILTGIFGFRYSTRAASAQWTYHDLKFSSEALAFADAEEKAIAAQDLYPLNYRLCDWMAERAWERYDSASKNRAVLLKKVGQWADEAVALNPYPRSIRETRRKYLEQTSPLDAVGYWTEFVDWSFWDPYNHAVLLELHVRTGNLEGALAEMTWVRGSPYAPRAVEFIRGLMDRELIGPSLGR